MSYLIRSPSCSISSRIFDSIAFVQTELKENIARLSTECAKLRKDCETLTKTPVSIEINFTLSTY